LIRRAGIPGGDDWAPFLPLIEEISEEQVFMPLFDCQNTLDGLAGSSVSCPPVSMALFGTYITYFNRTGFLDGPQQT
jgi:hypothetical protein